jgi:GT2 family glycosyltransferase
MRCVVIVLNFNGEHLLPACLDSIARQRDVEIETVVVDNGSTDGSAVLVAQNYPWARFLSLDKNYGFCLANNVALRDVMARGSDYAILLNNDTIAAPDMVSEMIAVIESDSRIAAVCPKIYFAHSPDVIWYAGGDFSMWTSVTRHRGWKATDRGQFDRQQEITQATGCAMLVRCSTLQDVGLLDEQFRSYAEDLEWSVRFSKKGYKLTFAPKAQLWHLDGATNVKAMASGSEAIRQYYSTRNMILLARKHVQLLQVPTFVSGFIISHVAFYTALRLWRRDFAALAAIYRGIAHGLTMSRVAASGNPVFKHEST